jgi:hypothetical protein
MDKYEKIERKIGRGKQQRMEIAFILSKGERNQGKKEENREGRQKEDRTRRDEFRQ